MTGALKYLEQSRPRFGAHLRQKGRGLLSSASLTLQVLRQMPLAATIVHLQRRGVRRQGVHRSLKAGIAGQI